MTVTQQRAVPRAASAFRAPTHVRNVIERSRLLGKLADRGARALTVIHAPAGYGKTTLAVQWLQRLERDGTVIVWLGLHRDDNDPRWFLSHLLEAVRRVLPAADAVIAELIELIEQNAEDVQGYTLSVLLDRIAAHESRVVVAFDDWHLVEDADVHRALGRLLDFAPPNLAVVLTSRRRPMLALSRLRVRGQLVEIDADALRFDLVETTEFLVELNRLELDGEDVARLSEGTDGWVAALQLALLSLRDSTDPAALIRGFSGRHHSVGEYLAENVLDALPAGILDFLLATSVCDRLCGDLAGALTGRRDGQAMLEELEARDLFLRPLDVEREWFRYHHLFADHLRRRLARDRPDRVSDLHARASRWFADHGLVSEAVDHALAGGDVGRATDLVEEHAMPLVEHSRMGSLLGLLGRLPATATDDRPRLLMAVAWANCLLQRSAEAQAALDRLRTALPSDVGPEKGPENGPERALSREEVHSEADVVQACIDIYGDRIDRAEALVSRSLARAGTYRPWVVAVAANIQTFCDIHAMRYRAARERQRWARPVQDRTRGPFAGVYGRCFAGVAEFAELDTARAGEDLRAAVTLARGSAGRRSHAAQLAGALLGELHYARGEIDEAARLLEESGELGAESGVVEFMVASYALLARIRAHRGATTEAAELLAEGARVAERLDLPRLAAAVGAERIDQLLAAGRVREARRVAQALPEGTCRTGGIGVVIDQLRMTGLAAVLSAEGDHDAAAALLEDVVADATGRGQRRTAALVGVRLAVVLERADRRLAAERTLAGALPAVIAADVPQVVRDGGPEVAAVLERLVGCGGTGALPLPVSDQLAALLASTRTGRPVVAHDLTGREVEILRMLDLGRTNQQIARSLAVTVNTVKWYLKSIYGKLDASNRTEAVSVARRSGLMPA
jgi:LuxR family maltose regulon positive regulatory protein/serine/threonine-protein kinase PknK